MLLERINLFVLLIIDPLRQLWRIRIWWPLLIYGFVQTLVLVAHYRFMDSVFYGPVSAWVSLFGSEQLVAFTHYPQQLMLLGKYAGWAKLLVGLPLEGMVLALMGLSFYRRFTGEKIARRISWSRLWINATVVWICINGLMTAAGMILPGLAGPFLDSTKRQLAFGFVFMPIVFTTIVAVFYMAFAGVAVRGMNSIQALLFSAREFFRRPILTMFLAGIILIVPALLSAVASRPAEIVYRFNPELVFWILLGSLLAELVALYFWIGGSVRWLLEPDR